MVEPGGGCLPTNLPIHVSRSWRQESDNNTYLLPIQFHYCESQHKCYSHAHTYTRARRTHTHARCILIYKQRKYKKAFLRAHTRVLQGIYIRGRTYAHTRAQISKNIYCIHYYDSRPISTRQHREPAAAYTFTFCHGLMSMQKLSYTSNVSAFFCMNKKISGGDSSSDILSDFQ